MDQDTSNNSSDAVNLKDESPKDNYWSVIVKKLSAHYQKIADMSIFGLAIYSGAILQSFWGGFFVWIYLIIVELFVILALMTTAERADLYRAIELNETPEIIKKHFIPIFKKNGLNIVLCIYIAFFLIRLGFSF